MSELQLFAAVLLVVVAPAVGSFLGVVADRLPAGRPIVAGRSACEQCGHRLEIRDLVPVASNTALFDLNNDYTVTFTADAVSDSVQVVAGDVSLVSDSATVRLYDLLTGGNWRLNEITSDGLARLMRIGETSHEQ